MAPSNLSDDVAALSAAVGGLFRLAFKINAGSVAEPAAAAGMSVSQAMAFANGTLTLPPKQTVAFVNACLERSRLTHARLTEFASTPRENPDPAATVDGAREAVVRLTADFPGWAIGMPDGWESLDTEKPKVVWHASRPDGEWPDLHGVSAAELRHKIEQVEASRKVDAERTRSFFGR